MVQTDQIIVCSHCGTKNRLPQLRVGRPLCGKCGKPLASSVGRTNSTASRPASSRATVWRETAWLRLLGLAALAVLGAGGALLFMNFGNAPSDGSREVPAITDWEPVILPPKAPPPTRVQEVLRAEQQAPGVIYNRTGREPLAPLTVVTSAGGDFYVKLVDQRTKSDLIGIYVHGGQRLAVKVPLGDYELRYAAGQTWYGITHRFGQDTVYFRADQAFTFSEADDGNGGYRIKGYTIELILQPNGNLTTTPIGALDF